MYDTCAAVGCVVLYCMVLSSYFITVQLFQLRLSLQTMNYERARDDGLLFVYALILRKLPFVASKFAIMSFLCAVDAVSKK